MKFDLECPQMFLNFQRGIFLNTRYKLALIIYPVTTLWLCQKFSVRITKSCNMTIGRNSHYQWCVKVLAVQTCLLIEKAEHSRLNYSKCNAKRSSKCRNENQWRNYQPVKHL